MTRTPATVMLSVRRRTRLPLAEEEGTIWLWALPSLLGWPRRIHWLYAPVCNEGTGDLWGADDAGALVVVEAKRARTPVDPFGDFVLKGLPDARRAEKKWRAFLPEERAFITNHCDALQLGTLPRGRYRGIVPYSKGRERLQRWARLYAERIAPVVMDPSAEHATASALATHGGDVHAVALFVTDGGERPRFSARGRTASNALRGTLGSGHVHVRAVACESLVGGTRFSGWTPTVHGQE